MITLQEELEKIVQSIETNYHPEKIILFGSLASGQADEESDIDIMVIKQTDKDPWLRTEEIDRFIQHDVPIDILVYTPEEIEDRLRINDFFVREILEKGIILYER